MIVPAADLVGVAAKEARGVGAFNVIQLEHAEAIVAGAERAGTPVILQLSENTVRYHGRLEPLGLAMIAIARSAAVPVVVHLDHATDAGLVRDAVGLGFGSVMFDGSRMSYVDNVTATAEVARYCHEREVFVEAELGEVGGKDGVHSPGARTDPFEAGRFVAATGVDALAVAVGTSGLTLMPGQPMPFNIPERLEYLKLYGSHTMAYSLLQREMNYFDLPLVGFLGYRTYGNTDFVLAHPICAEKDRGKLLGSFLETHPNACFVQITESFSSLLRESHGFYTVQMGVETWIDGEKWSLSGPSKTHLRRWINTAKNAGLTVTDVTQADIGCGRCAVHNEWQQTRTQTHALTFLTREAYSDPEFVGLTRLFGAYKGKDLLAVVEFDPIFSGTGVWAYYVNFVQFTKEAPNGTTDYIVSSALSQFITEGAGKLSFGMSPLAKLRPCANEPPFVRSLGSWLYRHANSFYNFKGNYFHKEKYRGEEIPVFYATRKRNALPDVFRLFRLVGIR